MTQHYRDPCSVSDWSDCNNNTCEISRLQSLGDEGSKAPEERLYPWSSESNRFLIKKPLSIATFGESLLLGRSSLSELYGTFLRRTFAMLFNQCHAVTSHGQVVKFPANQVKDQKQSLFDCRNFFRVYWQDMFYTAFWLPFCTSFIWSYWSCCHFYVLLWSFRDRNQMKKCYWPKATQ